MKLTEEQVLTIRMLYLDGETQQAIAEQFHIGQGTVSKIITGMAYGHVPKPIEVRCCVDCKTPLDGRGKRCETCKKIQQDTYFKQWYRERKARSKPAEEWICVECKTSVEGGKKRCGKCHKAHQDTYFIKRYRRLKAERLAKQSEVPA